MVVRSDECCDGPSGPVDGVYALPENGMRHELLDGTLLVTPPPSVPHQLAARRLVAALAAATPPDIEAVGVGVPAGLLVPDVVIASSAAVHAASRELACGDVLAVAEVVSTSSRTNDGRLKPTAYGLGGIGFTSASSRAEAATLPRSSFPGWSAAPIGSLPLPTDGCPPSRMCRSRSASPQPI